MSIVESYLPTGKPSAQDSLWNIAYSDNSGQTNFKYVFDIHDANGNQLIRTKIFPDVNNGRGYFDAGGIVRNLMQYDWFTTDNLADVYEPDASGEIAIDYQVRIGEDYNIDASGITTLNMASGTVRAFNWTPGAFDRGSFNLDNYSGKFLTTRSANTFTIHKDEPFYIPYYNSSTSTRTVTVVKTIANGSTTTYTVSLAYTKSVGFKQMNLARDPVALLLSYPDDNDLLGNAVKYTFRIGSGDTLTFIIDDCKGFYEPRYLFFMNRFGMFETCKFGMVSKLQSNTTRKAFSKSGNSFETDRVRTIVGSKYNETKINYAQEINWVYRLTKDFPTDNEWQWMEELMYSPIIYLLEGGKYYPVTIRNTSYERFQQQYAKLKTFEIEVELNQSRSAFLR